jgi:hypothetical protein
MTSAHANASRSHTSLAWRLGPVAACVALAALSLLRPSAPTTDPWGWIVWGRETLHLSLDTSVGTPAWKPLPVLVTTPLALFGSAAPTLWLLFARAAGLMALVLSFRAGRRLAGPWAGALAALFVALSTAWVRALEHGYTEPLMVALALGALERHLAGRRLQALALGALVCLGRPEAFAFLLAYAAWSRRGLVPRWRAVALVAMVPVLWLGGDWWGAGDPLHARHVAGHAAAHFSGSDAIGSVGALAGPLLVAAALLGWWRCRPEPSARALAGGALAWTALLAAMAQAGYPGSDRFMVLPAAAVCVLGGAGVVVAVRGVAVAPRPVARVALVAGLAAVALLYLPPRLDLLPRDVRKAEARARSQQELRSLVRSDPDSCGSALLPPSLDWNAGAVAWDRDEPLERIGNSVTGARALSDGGPHVDLTAGRDRSTYGLRLPPGAGGEVYVPARHGPIAPHVPRASGLGARLDAIRGRWAEVDVCRRSEERRAQPRRVTRGA